LESVFLSLYSFLRGFEKNLATRHVGFFYAPSWQQSGYYLALILRGVRPVTFWKNQGKTLSRKKSGFARFFSLNSYNIPFMPHPRKWLATDWFWLRIFFWRFSEFT
jgi:hypothetical protein